uniref:Uncharacterized protein n=1 Tax=Lepeophtheirus salmonis TaxID=72036 RepID=A0A0K2TXQ7_LEPSM
MLITFLPNIIYVLKDYKDLNSLPKNHIVLNYQSQWDGLSIDEDYHLLLYHSRIFIPTEARKRVLQILNFPNARQLYF